MYTFFLHFNKAWFVLIFSKIYLDNSDVRPNNSSWFKSECFLNTVCRVAIFWERGYLLIPIHIQNWFKLLSVFHPLLILSLSLFCVCCLQWSRNVCIVPVCAFSPLMCCCNFWFYHKQVVSVFLWALCLLLQYVMVSSPSSMMFV